jgi:hypothetical protein
MLTAPDVYLDFIARHRV